MPRLGRSVSAAACVLLLSACAGRYSGPHYYGNRWDGRRGYDGNGDYGYDLNASRAEASSYRARAARSYPAPGPEGDPWGPHVREAAARFAIPEIWIREVMRQESGGRQQMSDGRLTTSPVGAMGLMQVMPATYDMLRRRHGLGSDPYEPRSNILAGAAYIKEMYDRFGSPGFLAAYNAGPDRTDAYLAGARELPDETRNYLARIAPRLGTEVAMSGPLAAYAGTAYAGGGSGRTRVASLGGSAAYSSPGAYRGASSYRAAEVSPADQAYAGGGMTGPTYWGAGDAPASSDLADRAYDGGGLVTATAPLGSYAGTGGQTEAEVAYAPVLAAPVSRSALVAAPQPVQPAARGAPSRPAYALADSAGPDIAPPRAYPLAEARQPLPPASAPYTPPVRSAMSMLVPVAAAASAPGIWGVQVGAFPDPAISRAAVAAARSRAGGLLASAQPAVSPVERNGTLYRARLTGLSANAATAACTALVRDGIPCLTVPPGS